jgi:hypothetical protein
MSTTPATTRAPTSRRDPVRIPGGVPYYERRAYVEVQIKNIFGIPVIGRIPWAELIASAKRCRPEEFQKP